MQKNVFIALLVFVFSFTAKAQVENIIVITSDGLRWQELFNGVDTAIANNKHFNQGDSNYIYKTYWDADPIKSREKVFPFFWKVFTTQGSIYGNRAWNNYVNVTNPYWFSYPGYNEIFTGYADSRINSNNFKPNPNTTLLEYLNTLPRFNNRIAAFGAWEAFDRILNQQRSGLPIFSAFDTVGGKLTPRQQLINQMLLSSYKPFKWDECLDVFTHYAAMEYLKLNKPKVLFIGYGETDEWAHHGMYRSYLDAAFQFDQWVGEIWQYIQTQPEYKNKTALFITTDHGRGDNLKRQWTSHGQEIQGANETWFMVLAPGLAAQGEVKSKSQYHTNQFAQTMASLLGETFKAEHPIGEKIDLNRP